jgi:hypothetical protein
MSDRREHPTVEVPALSMTALAEERLLVIQHAMVVDAMSTPLLPSLRIVEEMGAIPEAVVDEDTLPLHVAEAEEELAVRR